MPAAGMRAPMSRTPSKDAQFASLNPDIKEIAVGDRTYLIYDPLPSQLAAERQRTIEDLAKERATQILQPSTQNEPPTADALKDFLDLPKHEDFKCYLTKSFPPLTLLSTTQRIQKFVDHECGRKDKEGKLLIKPGGRHAYYRAIRCFFNWAYSPASGLDLKPSDNPITWVKPPKVDEKIMPAQDKKSLEVLLSHVNDSRGRALIACLIDSSGRLSEVSNIYEPDISWGPPRTIKCIAKGGKEVLMPFSAATETLLRDWFAEHPPNGGSIWGINKWGIVSMLRRLEKKSGIKCNAHSFRRGFASILRRNGVDSLDIMKLGHWKSIRMVQKYTESVDFEDSQRHYKAPMERPTDATCGLQKSGMVGREGFEPSTNGLKVHCSTRLS